jgi:hypothetical protein
MCVERADELEKLSNTRERLGDYLATVSPDDGKEEAKGSGRKG